MRDAARNKTKIYYALRNKKVAEDEWGNTKDVAAYSSPVELKISISANKGEASAQAFGADLQYDREMVTYDMSCPIDEYTRLWIDEATVPERNAEETVWTEGNAIHIDSRGKLVTVKDDDISVLSTKAHNYEVAAVSRSLNCIRYAVRRVNVSR